MKKMVAVLLLALSLASQVFAGNCDNYYDRAADGSKCGKRSAEYRPGGR